jgi:endonuclease-3
VARKSVRQAARRAPTASRRSPGGRRRAPVVPTDAVRSGGAPRPRRRLRETAVARRQRAERILARLREAYPDARCALRHGSAYELLVATILSAQCTDERVNQVTPALFRRYPDAAALAAADPAELEALIRSTGFFRNKTRNLLGMAQRVCEHYGGQVPDTMDALLTLPGVARKTANCVLGTWFRKNEGVVVDTHVGRLAQRLGLLSEARDDKDAVKIERDLVQLFPREAWTWLAHALIEHGRRICAARKPDCAACTLAEDCPSAGVAR